MARSKSPKVRIRGLRVLVKEHESRQIETNSGIVIQRDWPTKLVSGIVIKVGELVPEGEPAVGETVWFPRGSGREWREFLIVEYDHIEGVGDAELLAL